MRRLIVMATVFAGIALSLLPNPALRKLGPPRTGETDPIGGAATNQPHDVS